MRLIFLAALLVVGSSVCLVNAQPATSTAPRSLEQNQAPQSHDDPVQMKATLIKLQVQVLERDREIGTLRAQVAELQLNALGAAVQTMDPAVKKALGIADKPVPPQTPPK